MKTKILLSIIFFLTIFTSTSIVSAYDLVPKDNALVKQYMSILESRFAEKPSSEWQKIGDILSKKLQNSTQTDTRKYAVISALTDQVYNMWIIRMFEEKLSEKKVLLTKAQTKYNSGTLSNNEKTKLKTYIDALTTEVEHLASNIKKLKELQ